MQQELSQNDGAIDGAIGGAIGGATKSLKRKLAVLLKAIMNDEGKMHLIIPQRRTLVAKELWSGICSNFVRLTSLNSKGTLRKREVITLQI